MWMVERHVSREPNGSRGGSSRQLARGRSSGRLNAAGRRMTMSDRAAATGGKETAQATWGRERLS